MAKLLAGDGDTTGAVTVAGARPMTPRYASPEQERGEPVTTASDVYSLGIVLRDLLSAADEGDPRRLSRRLAGDIESILLVALHDDPARRPASAQEFAEEIQRHLDGQPVHARRDVLAYRAAKFIRRNRLAVVSGVAVVLLLIGATVVSTAARIEAERQRAIAQEVSEFLGGILASVSPQVAQGRDVSVLREVVDRAARRLAAEIDPRSEVAASLHLVLGTTYRELADYEHAAEHLRASLAAQKDAAGLATVQEELGLVLLATNALAEAEPHLRSAVELRREAGDKPGEVSAIASLAQCLEAAGRYDEARARHREALDLALHAYGPGHPVVANRMSDLAVLLMGHDGKLDEAEPLLRNAVAILRVKTSLDLATAQHNLGGLLRRRQAVPEAMACYKESLAIKRRFLGPGHPDVALTLTNLGGLEESAGNYAQADTFYRQSLEIRQNVFGELHRDVGTTLNNLGGLRRKERRYREAEDYFTRAAAIYREALGPDHAWVWLVLTNHVHLLEDSGDQARSGPLIEEIRRLTPLNFPSDSWRAGVAESMYGSWLARAGRLAEGEPLLREGLAKIEGSLGSDDTYAQYARQRLADGQGR